MTRTHLEISDYSFTTSSITCQASPLLHFSLRECQFAIILGIAFGTRYNLLQDSCGVGERSPASSVSKWVGKVDRLCCATL